MNFQVNPDALGFMIPTFGEMLTFLVKGFFVVAGIATLIMLLWGALAWILSGGDKEQVEAARNRMVAALVGLFLILVALSTVWTLEQIVFKGTVCFGLSCPVSIPQLLIPRSGSNSSNGATGQGGSKSNTSHIFAKPRLPSPMLTGSGIGGQATPSNSTNSRLTPTNVPTPTGIQRLPGTGL